MEKEIEVTIPLSVPVQALKFLQKVTLQKVTIDPYGRTTKDSTYADVIMRYMAENILDGTGMKSMPNKQDGQK